MTTVNNHLNILLAVESSCDDTAASVWINGKIRSNVISSQKIHAEYGGVVPEMASRQHQSNILPVIDQALSKADISITDVNAIACTQGPGLMGSLLVGYTFCKGLSLALDIPFINIDHIHAHLASHFIDEPTPEFPFLCFLVSGGHTHLVLMNSLTAFEILGKTIDDAAGEAFDKAGKMLELPYPAGPVIDAYSKSGDPKRFAYNIPKNLYPNYSFSGIKTSILYFIRDQQKINPNFVEENIFDLCASIQHTIVLYLIDGMEKTLKNTQIKGIGIAGGVAANSLLREKLMHLGLKYNLPAFIPKMNYCTDNAAMIGRLGYEKWQKQQFGTIYDKCYTRNENF